MINLPALTISIFLIVLQSIANAQTWTSPDGFLSVKTPNTRKFQEVATPPSPFVGLWLSNDETVRLGVVKLEISPDINLNRASAEKGLAEEIGGEITRSSTKTVSGHEVWQMTAIGPSAEITQALIRNNECFLQIDGSERRSKSRSRIH